MCAFVVLKGARPSGDEAQKIAKELRDWVGKEIGAIAKPKDIRFGDNLPKTRSGKIMRRLLRSIAKGEEITQDVSTLENPAILEQLKQSHVMQQSDGQGAAPRSRCSSSAACCSTIRCCRCSTCRRRCSACRCSTPTSSPPGRCWSALMALVIEARR